MKNVSSIAVIALASSLALLATGCDRKPADQTAGEKMDNAATDSRNAVRDMGDTMERKADQAGQAIDDASITATIKGKYLVDDTLKGLDISVDTEQGVVKLTGPVQSDTAKELATQIAQNVEGVVRVDNQLTVQ
ncbi:BON domain-containing protein [Thiobacillus denitrificans]|uniref:Periplasmic protein n=1 Tax=Thiobacillus denitrificans TaxID=36861 RepID=A0A106BP78_THIDE|nr:BON domain-containing protein [Thiobacillus denitrificans]KVW96113.1 periplasmic protein [Thiobacillus denitrificans]